MASKIFLKNRNDSIKEVNDKHSHPNGQRAGLYSDNINPLGVLISLPLASLHKSMNIKRKRAISMR